MQASAAEGHAAGGRPLLERLVDTFKAHAINDITVVAGYRAETVAVPGVQRIDNPAYASTGELASLACVDSLGDDTLLVYGDLVFRAHVLRDLLEIEHEIVIVVDSDARGKPERDPVWCSAADDRGLFDQRVCLNHIGAEDAPRHRAHGRWIGLMRVRGDGQAWLAEAMADMRAAACFAQAGLPELLNRLVARGRPVRVHYIAGHWLDVNDLDDLRAAGDFARHCRAVS